MRIFLFLVFAVMAASGYATDIVDPAILEGLRNSVCFSESFEEVPVDENSKLSEGIVGKAYETVNNYTINVEKILPQGSGSISWWARHNFDSTAGASLLSLDNGGSLYLNFYGTSSSDYRHKEIGHFYCKLFGPVFAQYAGTIKPETWHNFIITWEGDEMTVYFDGGLCSSAKCNGSFSSMGVKILTLGNPYASQKKDVKNHTLFDELRIYNRALTAAEARAYFIAFKQGGAVKEMAAMAPDKPASRDALGLRAAYRISDHSIQVYGDLAILAEQAKVDLRMQITGEKGEKIFEKTYAGVNPKELFYQSIPVQELPDGMYSVSIDVAGKNANASFLRHKEEWENNKIGVTDKVIDPWTPITVDKKWYFLQGREASCWGRKYTFGALGLPEKILSTQPEPTRGDATCELLAKPVSLRIDGVAGPIKVAGKSPKLNQRSEGYVDVSASGNAGALSIQTTGTLEFDGFYKFKLRIEPKEPVDVKSISLEVALPDKIACLFNASGENMRGNKAFLDLEGLPDGLLWDSIESNIVNDGDKQKRVKVRRSGNIGNFYPHLWFGDDDRGIAFMGDSTRGWVLDENKPCQDLLRENGKTILRLHLVNTATTLREPIETTLSLQATPIRPRPRGGSWKNVQWYGWGHFDEPVLWKDCFKAYEEGKSPGANGPWYRTPGAKEKNLWWRYFCFQSHRITREDPAYGDMIQRSADEWGAGLHVPSHQDFLLWAYKQWHDIASMDGIYYDNTYVYPTTSLGSGLAWRDAEGKTHGSYNSFADREFMKRVRTYFLEQGPPAVLKVHITDAPIVGYLGFSDFWMDGENGGYLSKEQEEKAAKEGNQIYDFVDRWYSKTGMTNLRITLGQQWGTIPEYLYSWGLEPTQAVLGIFGLDNSLWRMNGIKDEFGCSEADVQFMPYWGNLHPAKLISGGPDVFLTAWKRPALARILVSNLSAEPRNVELEIDLAKLGLPENAVAVDEQTHEPVNFSPKDGMIRNLTVNRHGYRIILFGAPGVFTLLPGSLEKSMYPAKRIESLCDSFKTLSAEWQPKGRQGEKNCFGLWNGMLSISGAEGQVIALPFGEDDCSVQVKISTKGSFWDGGPSLMLYWNKDSYAMITAGAMRPMPNGPKIRCKAVAGGIDLGDGIGPLADTVTWAKIRLSPEKIHFYYSTDAKEWVELKSIPRKGLEGAPAMLLLGTPMPGAEFCVGKGRGDGTVFFGDLVTGK